MTTVEILAVGNEILLGDVLDTNTNWICKKVTGLGGNVQRAVLLQDDQDGIASELKNSFSRRPDLIITTGGMGPTEDDITLTAVAIATGHLLKLDDRALDIVKKRYEYFNREGFVESPEITPSRRKMALIPEGSTPLDNPVGTAPAITLKHDKSLIVCLPGVPPELQGIFAGSLQPTLTEFFGNAFFLEKVILADCGDESVLAPLLKSVSTHNSRVYVKSRAKKFGKDIKFRVTVSMAGSSQEEVLEHIERTIEDLRLTLKSHNIGIQESDK